MKSLKHILYMLIFSLTALSLVSCGPDKKESTDMQNESAQTDQEQSAQMNKQVATVNVNEKDPYGSYLVDGEGMSLYLFLRDTGGKSTCYDECAEAWPPLLTTNENINQGQGVNPGMLGTVKRRDGSMQVTYNEHPLYYYEDDAQAGDVAGQDKKEYGAEWYLVKPSGSKMGDVEE